MGTSPKVVTPDLGRPDIKVQRAVTQMMLASLKNDQKELVKSEIKENNVYYSRRLGFIESMIQAQQTEITANNDAHTKTNEEMGMAVQKTDLRVTKLQGKSINHKAIKTKIYFRNVHRNLKTCNHHRT